MESAPVKTGKTKKIRSSTISPKKLKGIYVLVLPQSIKSVSFGFPLYNKELVALYNRNTVVEVAYSVL